MIFSSYAFILGFLPVVLAGYYLLAVRQKPLFTTLSHVWLVLASLVFYGWFKPEYVLLLVFSVLANFGISQKVAPTKAGKGWLVAGIVFNLGMLGYFKYANFFVDNVAALAGLDWAMERVFLPLGISFFSFQQIAFLVDTYRGLAERPNFLKYSLFVTFFPQLLAGPINHYQQTVPQFFEGKSQIARNIAVGLAVFGMGLFKKVALADSLAVWVNPVFSAAKAGEKIALVEAWSGALAYTLQLYFDFSGYSDMAIGVACMFGIVLPINFLSPYKSLSIVNFWQRWHITLSTFLRDYLYIPMGGSRAGAFNHYRNLFLTMVLGGLWHGAGWTFIIWGTLHGVFLGINHGWRAVMAQAGLKGRDFGRAGGLVLTAMAWGLTFLCVTVAWVFFRADTLASALVILRGMAGLEGISLPLSYQHKLANAAEVLAGFGVTFDAGVLFPTVATLVMIAALMAVVVVMPNSMEVMQRHINFAWPTKAAGAPRAWLSWQPTAVWAVAVALMVFASFLFMSRPSGFLYFNF